MMSTPYPTAPESSRASPPLSFNPLDLSKNKACLPATVCLFPRLLVIDRHTMPVDFQRRQIVTLIGISEVARLLHEHRPRCEPRPELLLHVRIQRQIARLLRIALKEPRQRLPGIHHAQEPAVMNQFLMAIRRWRRREHKPILNRLAKLQEILIGLAAKRPQDTRLVQIPSRKSDHRALSFHPAPAHNCR
jgi:hypothetical protein